MNLNEIKPIINLLEENNFLNITTSDNPDIYNQYFTAAEIARRIDVRLDSEMINEALTGLGYKTFYEKVGVPTNPDNSAFAVKLFEDELTGEKKYYIQALWHRNELEKINKMIMENPNFQSHAPAIEQKNKEYTNQVLKEFKNLNDYVVLSVKKTGFNPNQDFVIYIGYSIFSKVSGTINTGSILIDDDLDDSKTHRYLTPNEVNGLAPFDYIKIQLPTMDDCNYRSSFIDRLKALRQLFKIVKDKDIVFYDKNEEVFINKMFENEPDIPEMYHFKNITNKKLYFKELIDWLEPKDSFKFKDVARRYNIQKNSGNGFSQEVIMLTDMITRVLKRY